MHTRNKVIWGAVSVLCAVTLYGCGARTVPTENTNTTINTNVSANENVQPNINTSQPMNGNSALPQTGGPL